jgi:hypothetical protein
VSRFELVAGEMQGERSISLARAHTHKRGNELALHPAFPGRFVRADDDLVGIPDKRELEQQWLFGELFQPPFVRKLRVVKPELTKPLRVSINECRHTKFLGEPAKLAKGCWALQKIDKMGFDSPLRKEAKSLARVRAFPDSENLYFQRIDWL